MALSGSWRIWLPLCGILAASLVLYRSAIDAYFLADDFGYLQLYARTALGAFPGLFAADWSQGIWGSNLQELRPLIGLTYWAEYRLWGTHASGYHLGNLLYHALALTGLYFLVLESGRMLGHRVSASAGEAAHPRLHANAVLATSLFLVHPAHVEAVVWIAGRTDLLGAAAYFWSMYCLARSWRTHSVRYAVTGTAILIAGLFTKENVITMPAMFVMYAILTLPSRTAVEAAADAGLGARWKQLVALSLPLAGAALLWIVLRRLAFGGTTSIGNLGEAITALGERLPFYAAQSLPVSSPLTAIAVLLLACVMYGVYRWNSIGRMVIFWALLWTAVHIAPLVAVTYQSSRHVFLATAGLLVAVSTIATLPASGRSVTSGRVVALGASALSLFLLVQFGRQTTGALPAWDAASRHSRQLLRLLRDGNYSDRSVVVVKSAPPPSVWFWHWSLPFAVQPPFMDFQARIVGLPEWSCCAYLQAEREATLAAIAGGTIRQVHEIEFDSHTSQFEVVSPLPPARARVDPGARSPNPEP